MTIRSVIAKSVGLLQRWCIRLNGRDPNWPRPSYRAGIVMFLGVGLALRNWITLAVLLAPLPLVAVEERALAAVIGVPYQRHMRRTKRFVPFLF